MIDGSAVWTVWACWAHYSITVLQYYERKAGRWYCRNFARKLVLSVSCTTATVQHLPYSQLCISRPLFTGKVSLLRGHGRPAGQLALGVTRQFLFTLA